MSQLFRDLLKGDAPMAIRVLLPVWNVDTGEEMTWREFLDAAGRTAATLKADSDWGEISELSGTGRPDPIPRCQTAQGTVPQSVIATLDSLVDDDGTWDGLSQGPAFTEGLKLRDLTFREATRLWPTRGLSGYLRRQDDAVTFSQPPYADSLLITTTNEIGTALLDSSLEAFEILCLDTRAPRMTL